MADKKISALTAAALPLAGTEVLPIVQSGATVKVASDDLTVKNVRSNATTGILQVAGPAAGTTRTMTTPNANFTAARTDAAQSFTGDQTLSTGNLIQGTAAKGFNFTANTPAAGATSRLLNWYEEGTWTPTLTTAGGNFSAISYGEQIGTYTRVGREITVRGYLWTLGSITGGSGQVYVAGLPFSAASLAIGNVWVNPDTGNYNSPIALPTGSYTSGTQLRLFKNGTTNNPAFNSTDLAVSGNSNYIAFTTTYFV